MVTKIGLDLGYASITLSDVTAGILREPSVALLSKGTGKILALGSEALSASDSADGMLVRPFKNGFLYSADLTYAVIENAIRAVGSAEKIRCVMGLPSDILPKQEKEIFDMLQRAGVTQVYGVTRSMAALVGAGYSPAMSVISVNVGASHTDVSVVRGGEIILKSCESVGGEDFDLAVQTYIKDEGDVTVSLSVAKAIKERLGAVWEGKPSESLEIAGTLSMTGHRVSMTLTSEDVVSVFDKPLYRLLHAIADTVKKIPTADVEAIMENGIVLTGGGAELFGLDRMIEKVLGIRTTLAIAPIDCVARGLSRINAFLPSRSRAGGKNVTAELAKIYEAKK